MRRPLMHVFLFLIVLPGILLTQESAGSDPVETELGFKKITSLNFEEALTKVKAELKKEGFGILTEVDVKATLKNKMDVDFKPYHILGACNPPLAKQALETEAQIGLLLPCKFIVYVNDNDETVIMAVDPVRMMQSIENEDLAKVARQVQEKFLKVLENI